MVEVRDPRALSPAEKAEIVRRCRRDNMALFASAATGEDKEVPRRLGAQLGLATLDTNFLADEDGITSIAVSGAKAGQGFIPYTTHRIRWHTDGYYNPPQLRIRAMLLHCVRDAASGGDTALIDHELAYLLLRDDDPAHVRALMQADALSRSSFEVAEKRLSADLLNFSTSTSSLVKGETLLDTARNLEAMNPDFLVIRHSESGAPHFLSRHCRASVVNAGDGAHEHPTQALLDAFTMRHHKGRLAGLRVAIIGDILHSRVARSNAHLLTKMGADLTLCGPPTLIPRGVEALGCRATHRMDEAVEGADVVMMLRIQLERMVSGFFPTLREYAALYGLDETRLRRAAPVWSGGTYAVCRAGSEPELKDCAFVYEKV